MRRYLFLLVMLLGLVLAGCDLLAGRVEIAQSEQPRDISPGVKPEECRELTAGNQAFAFDLYRALCKSPGNLIFCPHGLSAALAQVYAGARGETARQMAQALHFTLPPARLHAAFNQADLSLAHLSRDATDQPLKDFRLEMAVSLWVQQGNYLLPEFLDLLAENYGANLALVDFRNDLPGARRAIDQWANRKTDRRLLNLVPSQYLDPSSNMVLADVGYLKDRWLFPFEKALTHPAPFTLPDGRLVTAEMMSRTGLFGYAAALGCQAVELPYRSALSLLILLPKAGGFTQFEQALTARQVAEISARLTARPVALTMPKFRCESQFNLAETLSNLGMPLACAPRADFSGMSNARGLFLGAVAHKTLFSVNEAGTEVATSAPPDRARLPGRTETVNLTIDRPFVFLVRDSGTGALLLLGRVLDPTR